MSHMKGPANLLTGMVLGAGAMYLLDPDRGTRRRSLLRDQSVHAGHKLRDGLSATARDARNRVYGTAAELRSRFREDASDDEVVHERVRSGIGRVVSHPSAIQVVVEQARVTLRGDILADEIDALIKRVQGLRGVKEVQNELKPHATADDVPALRGAGRVQRGSDVWEENWSPTARVLAGAIGGALAFEGIRSKGLVKDALGILGLALLSRAATNLPAGRLVGLGDGPRGIDVQKTIRIDAPVEQVWDLWSNFENFPRFMSHVQEVRRIDENRSRWVAVGPGGAPVAWEALVTAWTPKELIAWKSVEDSVVDTAGQVRFREVPGGTEVDVQLSYNPPAGALGHAVAWLFRADPKHALDEDMVRLKSLLEEAKIQADGEQVKVGEIAGGSSRKRRSTRKL